MLEIEDRAGGRGGTLDGDHDAAAEVLIEGEPGPNGSAGPSAGESSDPTADGGEGRSTDASVVEYRLNDDVLVRVRVEPSEGAVTLTFLDGEDRVLPESPITLPEDFRIAVGPAAVTGHGTAVLRLPVAGSELHDGLLRTFVVEGCRDVKFFQYVRSTVTLDPGTGAEPVTGGADWHLDGRSPYFATFPGTSRGSIGMVDGPGTGAGFDPFRATVAMAAEGDIPPPDVPAGATFTIHHEFETVPYGDGTPLGIIAWGYTLTWRFVDGATTGPVVAALAPEWQVATGTSSPLPPSAGAFRSRVISRAAPRRPS